MNSLRKLSFLIILLASCFFSYAQNTVTGKVLDSAGRGISGINVLVKGSTRGASTSGDGSFSISAPAIGTLVISGVGFTTQEVAINSRNSITVTLLESHLQLNEVIVTALGVRREKKALTYAAQQVSGDELRKASNSNFMDALSGKAAGLNIETSNSGAGGSTKAILRGDKSIEGVSNPLYVIDGIPLVNNVGGQPGSYGGTDGGDGLSAVNPADIESLTVLRGANAAILYGSLGANGVILITTKKGKAGAVKVDFSSSTIFDQVSELPHFQFRYGSVGGDYSWTPVPTGTPVSALINAKSPVANVKSDNYQKDYIKDFFRTGLTETNAASVYGGNEKTTAYFSYANTSANGVLPTNRYSKNQFSFNQSTKVLNDKVTLSSNVMFSNERSYNRPGAGYYNNPLTGLYLFARDRDFASFKNNYAIFDSSRNMPKMNWYSTEEKQNNPYWEINKDPKLQTSTRIIANLKAAYQIAPHLRFEIRGNVDYNDVTIDYEYAADGNSVSVSPNGTYNYSRYNDKSYYSDGLLFYNNNFGNFSVNAFGGLSYQYNAYNDGMSVNNGTTSLRVPNFFTFSNMPSNVTFNKTINREEKQGAFGDVTLGFKDFLFLDVAGRNDWASTLALTGNYSYFYPSVGLSAVLTQMFKLPEVISFWKVRGSITQVANEVPFNRVDPASTQNNSGIVRPTQFPFTTLKPEKIASNEYGTEIRFFNNRLGLEFTVYNDVSTNQFVQIPAPSGSGYTIEYINAGKITNKGIEFTLNAEIVRNRDFSWKTAFNGSTNKNKIVTLIASDPGKVIGGQDEGFDSRIQAGGSFNDLWIYEFLRNAQGQIVLDPTTGVPQKNSATETKVGNVNPNFLLGWNNTFQYKRFFASVLVNAKFGGVAFSKTEAFLDSYGVSERTAAARDKGFVPINATLGTTGTAVTQLDPYTYYQPVGDRNGIMEPYVFSRTNVRLSQVALGYDFVTHGSVFKAASVSLIGRNLFFFYKKAPFDPEQAMSTSNSMQSNDVFSLPATRSFGFNVKFTF